MLIDENIAKKTTLKRPQQSTHTISNPKRKRFDFNTLLRVINEDATSAELSARGMNEFWQLLNEENIPPEQMCSILATLEQLSKSKDEKTREIYTKLSESNFHYEIITFIARLQFKHEEKTHIDAVKNLLQILHRYSDK